MRNMALAATGDVGAVYAPLGATWLYGFDGADVPSKAEEEPFAGSLKADARGVSGTGEGCAEDIESGWGCEELEPLADVTVICVGGFDALS